MKFIKYEVKEKAHGITVSIITIETENASKKTGRPEKIKVEYYNENFEKVVEEFDRFACRMVQHELSHLEGNLFVDNVSPIRRKMIARKLQAISKGAVQTRYKSKK